MGEIINFEYEFYEHTFFLESPYDDWFHTPEFIEDLVQLTDKDCFHGEEYSAKKDLEIYYSSDPDIRDPVLTGVYTIRFGVMDRVFTWLRQIGNRNRYTNAKYSDLKLHGFDELEDHDGERLRNILDEQYLDIENLIFKHKERPAPSEMLTFHIKQFSEFKKEFMKKPRLFISHYELEFFHHPLKESHVFENTPFDSYISEIEIDKDIKGYREFGIKEKFLSKDREVVELFINHKRYDREQIKDEIKQIICLIHGIYGISKRIDHLLKDNFNNKNYDYDKNSKLPTEIVNILEEKMEYEIPEREYGITYHPIFENIYEDGEIKNFDINYSEEDFLEYPYFE